MNYADLFADVTATADAPRSAPLLAATAPVLSVEQHAALVSPYNRSAVICAGAGAGKTKLLVERASALIRAGADPKRVAVVTFTRKAAEEIQARMAARIGDKSLLPFCGTVHSLALRRLASQRVSVTLASDDELKYFLDQLRDELPEDYDDFSDEELLLAMNRTREEESSSSTMSIIAARFEEMLEEEEAVDFTGLLQLGVQQLSGYFDYILVDEAQDLSSLQRTFLRKLGRPNARYWYIGDGDQAIYAFRGAHGGVMKELQAECDDMHVLSMNYRSALSIVEHANNVISCNPDRFPIEWKAHRTDIGEVVIDYFEDADSELNAVREWLQAAPKTRAVLARTQALIESLRALDLPAFSVHESKGLEWEEVWVMGCEAALFPHPLGVKEEERRLFYVAMTRAKSFLRMSYAATRSVKRNPNNGTRNPSGFLFEAHGLEG